MEICESDCVLSLHYGMKILVVFMVWNWGGYFFRKVTGWRCPLSPFRHKHICIAINRYWLVARVCIWFLYIYRPSSKCIITNLDLIRTWWLWTLAFASIMKWLHWWYHWFNGFDEMWLSWLKLKDMFGDQMLLRVLWRDILGLQVLCNLNMIKWQGNTPRHILAKSFVEVIYQL